jgi:VIT1/CCC1 family predicted Fe2+/Mn2+ transporter
MTDRDRHSQHARLAAEHHPDAIRARLASEPARSYLKDMVLGAIDGCVTTFAIVSAAAGAALSGTVIVILGLANLLADGISMAVSNYQATKTEREGLDAARRQEEEHIRMYPEGEREEIRQIFARKGFAGPTLERIVEVIGSNREVWVDTMLKEELGLHPTIADPMRAALATLSAFVLVGMIPLLPFVFPLEATPDRFIFSSAITAITFFCIGMSRGLVLNISALRAGSETLIMGGSAAALAFAVGAILQRFGLGT